MKSQFRAVNRFISKVKSTSSIDGISSSGTFQVEDISVAGFSLPQGAFTYFVTADFAQTGKEEIFRIINTSGDTLTYDKRIPVGGYVKPTHAAGASIRVNDVADILNEMSDNIDNFGDINQIDGTQTIKVWGGVFNNGGTVYNVANQTLIVTVGQLVDNTTNYVHFDITTRLFIVTASSTLAAAVCIGSVVVAGGTIGAITDLRPGFAMTYGEISTKLDKSGGLRDTMQVTNTTTDGLFVAGKTKIPVVNADFAIGSGTQTTSGWIGGTITNGWYLEGAANVSASYDTGRMKISQTTGGANISVASTSAGFVGMNEYSYPVEPNTTYTVDYDMQTTLISGDCNEGAKLETIVFNSAGTSLGNSRGPFVKTTTGNTHYSYQFTTGATARYMNIAVSCYGSSGAGTLKMDAWFDNIVISCPSKEILKPITPTTSMVDSDEFLFEKQDGSYAKAMLGDIKGNIAALNNPLVVAGEALTANDCITIERLNDLYIAVDNVDPVAMGNIAANTRISQKLMGNGVGFTTINVICAKSSAPTDNVTITIETDNAGSPSGTAVTNGTITFAGASFGAAYTNQVFTFPGTVTLADGVPYHLVFKRQNAVDPVNYYLFAIRTTRTRFSAVNLYNTSWGSPLFTYTMMINGTGFYKEIAVKSIGLYQALSQAEGFVQSSYSLGQIATIYRGIVNLSGLIPGAWYSVSDTAGAISTTAGTFKTAIGQALTSTKLLVSPSYPNNMQANPDIKLYAIPNGNANYRKKFFMKDSGTFFIGFACDASGGGLLRVTRNGTLIINQNMGGNGSGTVSGTFSAGDTLLVAINISGGSGNCNVVLYRSMPLINMLDIT